MKEEKLRELLGKMSLKEKAGQMFQASGSLYDENSVLTGPMKESGFTEENLELAGSVIGVQDAAAMRKLQERYIRQHPHGIPLLFMMDVINGYRTIFPIPLGQGASFDPDLTRRCAEAAAREASASGIHVTFAPMADLVRDARWGRVMESTGEDPFLNGLFCQAMVRGFQGDHVGESGRLAACVKHFAAYGAPVAGRDYNTVELSEHTLREYYLPAYKKGIEAGAEMVMTSFNTVNGIPATGNEYLMRQILRREFGFDGVLISDWTAIEELIAHGYCEDRKDAAYRAMRAGVDIDMMSGIYPEWLCRLVESGAVSMEAVDQAVWRILCLKNRLGLFENPYKDAGETAEKKLFLCSEHRALAREAAARSFVLLKNEDVLPLRPETRVAWIGPYTDTRDLTGSWSFTGDKSAVSTIREILPEYTAHTEGCPGCPMLDPETDLRTLTEKQMDFPLSGGTGAYDVGGGKMCGKSGNGGSVSGRASHTVGGSLQPDKTCGSQDPDGVVPKGQPCQFQFGGGAFLRTAAGNQRNQRESESSAGGVASGDGRSPGDTGNPDGRTDAGRKAFHEFSLGYRSDPGILQRGSHRTSGSGRKKGGQVPVKISGRAQWGTLSLWIRTDIHPVSGLAGTA